MSNAQRFLDGYLDAWQTNDPETIMSLFAVDATYRGAPGRGTPYSDIDEIVTNWLDDRDEPGTWGYEGGVVLETPDAAIIRGVTTYSDGPKSGVYDNEWLVQFDSDGRVSEFQDWWFERRA